MRHQQLLSSAGLGFPRQGHISQDRISYWKNSSLNQLTDLSLRRNGTVAKFLGGAKDIAILWKSKARKWKTWTKTQENKYCREYENALTKCTSGVIHRQRTISKRNQFQASKQTPKVYTTGSSSSRTTREAIRSGKMVTRRQSLHSAKKETQP